MKILTASAVLELRAKAAHLPGTLGNVSFPPLARSLVKYRPVSQFILVYWPWGGERPAFPWSAVG